MRRGKAGKARQGRVRGCKAGRVAQGRASIYPVDFFAISFFAGNGASTEKGISLPLRLALCLKRNLS